jgi:hypothetical protein
MMSTVWRLFSGAGRSLRAKACRARAVAAGRGWSQLGQATRDARLALSYSEDREWMLLGLIWVIAVVGLWAPGLIDVSWLPTNEFIQDFLPVAWQVQAAALGLSLAVVTFAFQSYSLSRFGAALRDFQAYWWVLPPLLLGLAALTVDALVLMGVGRDAPAGWAGAWAIALTVVSLASLPSIAIAIFRSMDPKSLQERRLDRVVRRVRAAVDVDSLERYAFIELNSLSKSTGWDFNPLFGSYGKGGWYRIAADADGELRDIDLRILRELGQPGSESHDQPVLLARIGSRVSTDDTLALLPPNVPEGMRSRTAHLCRIGRILRARDMSPIIAELHRLALQSIHELDPVWYEEVADAYCELLLAFPRAWLELGQPYGGGLTRSIDWLSPSTLNDISKNLYEEMRVAVDSGNRELMFKAADLPYRVLIKKRDLDAEGLAEEMLKLLVQAYEVTLSANNEHIREVGSHHASFIVAEHTQLLAGQVFDSDAEDDLRDSRRRELEDALRAVVQIIKIAIDYEQVEDVIDLDSGTRELLDRYQLYGTDTLETMRRELQLTYQRFRMGLCLWSVRSAHQDPSSKLVDILDYFASTFDSVRDLVLSTGPALRFEESEDRTVMWWLEPFGRSRFPRSSSVGTDLEMLRSMLVLAIKKRGRGEPVDVPLTDWIPSRIDSIRGFLDDLARPTWDAVFTEILDRGAVIDELRTAFDEVASAQRQAEAEALRNASLIVSVVDGFRRLVVTSWQEFAVVRKLFAGLGLISVGEGEAPAASRLRFLASAHKSHFTGERPDADVDDFLAREAAMRLGRLELRAFVRLLAESAKELTPDGETLASLIDSSFDAMSEAGYPASVMLMPVNPAIELQLGLRTLVGPGPERSAVWGDPGPGHWYRGLYRDAVVLQHNSVPDDLVLLASVERLGHLDEWLFEGEQLHVEVNLLNDTEAREMVSRSAPDATEQGLITQAERAREQAHIRVERWARVTVTDPSAVGKVQLPKPGVAPPGPDSPA